MKKQRKKKLKKIQAKTAEIFLATETFNNSEIEIQRVFNRIKENSKKRTTVQSVINELKESEKTLNVDVAKLIEDKKTKNYCI